MLNILSLICLNSALYLSNFFLVKLPKAYTFLSPIVNFMPVILVLFFPLSLCLASCCKLSMKSFILS